MVDGRRYQFSTAKFQKAAVTDPVTGPPIENANRIAVGDPFPQELARLVPVDQENQ